MKKTKLKIENFLEHKLENQIEIFGGDGGNNALPADPSGGGNVTGGLGSGETNPNGTSGSGTGTTPFTPLTPRSGGGGATEAPYLP